MKGHSFIIRCGCASASLRPSHNLINNGNNSSYTGFVRRRSGGTVRVYRAMMMTSAFVEFGDGSVDYYVFFLNSPIAEWEFIAMQLSRMMSYSGSYVLVMWFDVRNDKSHAVGQHIKMLPSSHHSRARSTNVARNYLLPLPRRCRKVSDGVQCAKFCECAKNTTCVGDGGVIQMDCLFIVFYMFCWV